MAQNKRDESENSAGDSFLGRMKAQCASIEQYRVDVLHREGRQLSQDEAAAEWIERYAAEFAQDQHPTAAAQ